MDQIELVVLMGDDGCATGTAPKSDVHTGETPLHLAFSCYLLDDAGRLLLTRRALAKRTWPGVWTNSFCGHPGPREDLETAVHRRAAQELNVEVERIDLQLPTFRYRAIDASGIVENEICPVFTAVARGPLLPEPSEVAEWIWVEPSAVIRSLETTPFVFSPWLREQLPALVTVGAFGGAQNRG